MSNEVKTHLFKRCAALTCEILVSVFSKATKSLFHYTNSHCPCRFHCSHLYSRDGCNYSVGALTGATEFAGQENAGLKNDGQKLQGWKMTDRLLKYRMLNYIT